MTETTPEHDPGVDEPDALDPQEQLEQPDAEPAESDDTEPEVAPGDLDWVEPSAAAMRPTKAIL